MLETAKSVDSPMILTNQVMEMMKILHADGQGQADHSGIAMFYEKLTGMEITR